jgi:hypothetical protein
MSCTGGRGVALLAVSWQKADSNYGGASETFLPVTASILHWVAYDLLCCHPNSLHHLASLSPVHWKLQSNVYLSSHLSTKTLVLEKQLNCYYSVKKYICLHCSLISNNVSAWHEGIFNLCPWRVPQWWQPYCLKRSLIRFASVSFAYLLPLAVMHQCTHFVMFAWK